MTTDRMLKWLSWVPALYAAQIMLWYEQFKLTGAEGSVMLFSILADWLWIGGYEKPFRLSVAIAEIAASVLVVLPRTRMWGAALSFGIISGAIFFHVFSPVGIDPFDDGAQLFKEAVAVWFASAFILVVMRNEVRAVLGRIGLLPAPVAATH